MKAMVLSAGYGTRFRPATYSIPKPLVPLCNRRLIGWVIEALIEFGVEEIIVNLHHLPDLLRSWLDREYAGRCAIHYSFEREILGTGGGLMKCRSLLEGEEAFLVVNGDTVQFPPYANLLEALRVSGAPAAMLLRRPPANDRFTGIAYQEGRVSSIGVEGEGESLMFSGVHAMTPEVFRYLPDRAVSGLTEDLYARLLEKEIGVGATIHEGLWFDVGSPSRYLTASAGLLSAISSGEVRAPKGNLVQPLQQVLLDGNSVVEGQVMRSTVAERSIVARGCQVVDSALWSGTRVGEASLVESSILAEGVELPGGSEVRNALVCRRTDQVPAEQQYQGGDEVCFVPIDPREPAFVRLGDGRASSFVW